MAATARADTWLGNDLAARFVIRLYTACHPATPTETVERLQAGFEQLRHNGDLAEYGLR